MNKVKIKLLQEEIDSLLNFNEVSIFNDDDKEIIICLDETKENVLRQDILDRYDNSEYHNEGLLK